MGVTTARNPVPRRRTRMRSTVSPSSRCTHGDSRRPWGIRRPAPPSERTGSSNPWTLTPSPTQRLSLTGRPPLATAPSRRVDLPTPPGPASTTSWPPIRTPETCSGTAPATPAHHSAGYCTIAERSSRVPRPGAARASARVDHPGRWRAVTSSRSPATRTRRSTPLAHASSITTTEPSLHAPRVSGCMCSCEKRERFSSTVTRTSSVSGSVSSPAHVSRAKAVHWRDRV